MAKYVVRVMIPDDDAFPSKLASIALLDCFRYAGLIRYDANHNSEFFMIAPMGRVSEVWAKQNADRMKSFGFDAKAVEAIR